MFGRFHGAGSGSFVQILVSHHSPCRLLIQQVFKRRPSLYARIAWNFLQLFWCLRNSLELLRFQVWNFSFFSKMVERVSPYVDELAFGQFELLVLVSLWLFNKALSLLPLHILKCPFGGKGLAYVIGWCFQFRKGGSRGIQKFDVFIVEFASQFLFQF